MKALRILGRAALTAVIMMAVFVALLSTKPGARVFAQSTGYRFNLTGYTGSGQQGGICFEPFYNAGPDTCLVRLANPGQLGLSEGGSPANGLAFILPNGTAVATGASTGGFIGAGTYYGSWTCVTATGGESTQATDAATSALTGSTNKITITAPTQGQCGDAVGYAPYLTIGASGTEVSQAIMSAANVPYCAGAFQIFPTVPSAYQAAQGDRPARWLCPFGTNWVGQTFVSTPTVVYSTTGQIGNQPNTTTTIADEYGYATPAVNTAAYTESLPTLLCNLNAQPANATITTIQTMGSCLLAAGVQNIPGKILKVTGHLVYTSGAQTGTMTISVTEGGITPIAVVSPAIVTGGQTNAQAAFDYYLTTGLTGTTGKVEPHGTLSVNLATAANGNILSVVEDQNTALSSALDLTASNTLAVTITMSSSTTSATLRDAQVWMLN